jgi:polyketide synthase PksJ
MYKEINLTLPTETTRALQAFVKVHHLTMNILLQGAWSILLSRYSGDKEVLFGATVSGRPSSLEHVETMIGLFINALPVRVSVTKDETMVPWLTTLHENQVEQEMYSYTPLVEIQTWSEMASNVPLFETLLIFENYPVDTKQMDKGSLSFEAFEAFEQTNYPLNLVAALTGDELAITFSYSTAQFAEETIQRMMGHLTTLLEGMITEDKSPVEIEMLTETEQKQLLAWNRTETEYPKDKTIVDLFEEQVEKTPDMSAVVFNDENLSYRELNAKANQLAHYLQSLGVKPEVLVGICLERSLEMFIGLLGILKAGGAYVPLDPNYPRERLEFMIEDSGMPFLITHSSLDLPKTTAKLICLNVEAETLSMLSIENPDNGLKPSNLVYLIYTSGSTGKSKGVLVSHKNLVHSTNARFCYYDNPPKRYLLLQSISFDSSVAGIFWTLCQGGALILPPPFVEHDTLELTRLIKKHQVSTLLAIPSLYTMLMTTELQHENGLETVIVAGESCPPELVERHYTLFPQVSLFNEYGPTEATVWSSVYKCLHKELDNFVSIGHSIINTQLHILDAYLTPVPISVPGELYIGGVGLARGYLNRPELTVERFIPNPLEPDSDSRLYKTGDLVRYLPNGNLEFLGRVDNQVKIRGFRIELGEIEAALGQHPSIQEAVVITRESSETDKHIVAYLVPQQDSVENADIRQFLSERLPEYMIPAIFVTLETLPLLPNGKVNRRALPDPGKVKGDEASYIAPRNEIEKTISTIWQDVLKVENPGINDNFFDLGGHSLLIISLQGRLAQALKRDIPVVDLFRYPTINTLAKFLSEGEEQPVVRETVAPKTGAIAIIGMAGRFPGARNLEEFWQNLREGVDSISFFTDEELIEAGIEPDLVQNPNYVKANGVLDDFDLFDANFFGFTPKEAETTNPQHRLFLEVAWEALESSGYNPDTVDGLIGVYAGSGMNTYLFENLLNNTNIIDSMGLIQLMHSNNNEFMPTQTSYKLNLKGPSINITTACSTSLVSVQTALRGLLAGDCDMALAGGVTISMQQKTGYLYQEGDIAPPDGHCRAFDAKAQGTVGSSGVGIVVLKRLDDAIKDGDYIHAVIKGGMINNDGSAKVGFTAPGVDGQMTAIAKAQAMAGIDPATITYVETHGTGTILGDPIEIEALTRAFRIRSDKKGYCAIGSVKTNIGHTDTAAGAAGLIKTVLSLEHQEIFPSLYFEKPNPKIDFENSPFYVNTKLSQWKTDGTPRRAGVSSFGIGGTNAHLVLEEAPEPEPSENPKPYQLLVFSARTESALEKMGRNFKNYLKTHSELNSADLAYTLQVGRKRFEYRRMFVCRGIEDAINRLEQSDSQQLFTRIDKRENTATVFMFPGVGDHYINMARDLYQAEKTFRETIDHCCQLVKSRFDLDLKAIIYPHGIEDSNSNGEKPAIDLRKMLRRGSDSEETKELNRTLFAQPAVFVIEYALAQLLMQWGIKPRAMIGYSTGEYTAACVSGVLSLEDTLLLLIRRAALVENLPGGSMLAVPLSEEELIPLLGEQTGYLGIVNGPQYCIVSGPEEGLSHLESLLKEKGVVTRRVIASHAFHSPLMEPARQSLTNIVKQVTLGKPKIPYISNLTGTWITASQTQDMNYWADHLCGTVRFGDGIAELLTEPDQVIIEVGPGQTLSTLVNQHPNHNSEHVLVSSLRHDYENRPDQEFLLTALGKLVLAGVTIDWNAFYVNEKRRRLPLPTYPFERRRYWVEPQPMAMTLENQKNKLEDWFYLPVWKPVPLYNYQAETDSKYLLFSDDTERVKQWEQNSAQIITVKPSQGFEKQGDKSYTIDLENEGDYQNLFQALKDDMPDKIIYFQDVVPGERKGQIMFYSLIFIARTLGLQNFTGKIQILVVTNGLYDVNGSERLSPEISVLLGPVNVIPQEYPNINCRVIDVNRPQLENQQGLNRLALEISSRDHIVALRGNRRWVQSFEPIKVGKPEERSLRLKERGVYLITGGLGNIGLALAEQLAKGFQARLILTSRSKFPAKNQWKQALDDGRHQSQKIRKLEELEAVGSEILVLQADAADEQQMALAIKQAENRFGTINGVIHAAGIVGGDSSMTLIKDINPTQCELQFQAKVKGLLVLEKILHGKNLDFCVLMSSLSTVLGGLGFVAYSAANHFMDAFAFWKNRESAFSWLSVNWDGWQSQQPLNGENGAAPNSSGDTTMSPMTPIEGFDALQRIISMHEVTQVVVSSRDLLTRINKWIKLESLQEDTESDKATGKKTYPRPQLTNDYIAPRDDTEHKLVSVWQDLLGIDEIGVKDDFFELGGHSLLALRLMTLIQQRFQKNMSLSELFEGGTIEHLGNILREQQDSLPWSPVVTMQKGDSKPAFFCIPGTGGYIFYLQDLVRNLDQAHPFYGLQDVSYDGVSDPYTRVEDLAAFYCEAIKRVQPNGPYYLGGHSLGAYVAFETARQLHLEGHEIGRVVLLDVTGPLVFDEDSEEAHLDDDQTIVAIAETIGGLRGINLEVSHEILKPLGFDEKITYLRDQLIKIEVLPPSMGKELVQNLVKVYKAQGQITYNPPQETCPISLSLFRAEKTKEERQEDKDQDPTWGWRQFSSKPITLYDVPGDHLTMMTEPHVKVLADCLQECLMLGSGS